MSPERPRRNSFSAQESGGIELSPMPTGGGRRTNSSADAQDRRRAKAQFSALSLPTGRPSRTFDALDLAHPKGASMPRAMLTTQAASAMRNAGKHGLDVNTLVDALGGKKKDRAGLKAHIEKNLGEHQVQHAAFAQHFVNKGFSALHQAPALAMKGVNNKLSEALAHRKSKK